VQWADWGMESGAYEEVGGGRWATKWEELGHTPVDLVTMVNKGVTENGTWKSV
jgi:hypothetical protein